MAIRNPNTAGIGNIDYPLILGSPLVVSMLVVSRLLASGRPSITTMSLRSPKPTSRPTYKHIFPLFHTFWSPGVPENHYTGVALMVKHSSCWATQELRWSEDCPCYPYWRANRLLAIQIWLGNGGTSVLVYVVYGPSGARWERHKHQYLHSLLDALGQDIAARDSRRCAGAHSW